MFSEYPRLDVPLPSRSREAAARYMVFLPLRSTTPRPLLPSFSLKRTCGSPSSHMKEGWIPLPCRLGFSPSTPTVAQRDPFAFFDTKLLFKQKQNENPRSDRAHPTLRPPFPFQQLGSFASLTPRPFSRPKELTSPVDPHACRM